jgi:hypothetical protein
MVDRKNLPDNTIDYIKFVLKKYIQDEKFTFFGW